MIHAGPTRRGVSQWSIQRTGGPQYRIVGATERVLVVEDSLPRILKFKKHLPNARLAATSPAAITMIQREDYDLICLDRDLSLNTYGEDVAHVLVARGFAGRVICHSENDFGARLIEKILMDGNVRCERVPFSLLGLVREVVS
jgi:hypothetical protein